MDRDDFRKSNVRAKRAIAAGRPARAVQDNLVGDDLPVDTCLDAYRLSRKCPIADVANRDGV